MPLPAGSHWRPECKGALDSGFEANTNKGTNMSQPLAPIDPIDPFDR